MGTQQKGLEDEEDVDENLAKHHLSQLQLAKVGQRPQQSGMSHNKYQDPGGHACE